MGGIESREAPAPVGMMALGSGQVPDAPAGTAVQRAQGSSYLLGTTPSPPVAPEQRRGFPATGHLSQSCSRRNPAVAARGRSHTANLGAVDEHHPLHAKHHQRTRPRPRRVPMMNMPGGGPSPSPANIRYIVRLPVAKHIVSVCLLQTNPRGRLGADAQSREQPGQAAFPAHVRCRSFPRL